jgi:CRISPR-associated protein Cas5h
MLETGRSHYVPSLGLSEHLAEIEYHGEFDVEQEEASGETVVDSAIPNSVDAVVPNSETRCQVEQSPGFMTADESGRTTTAFTTYTYNPDGNSLTVRSIDPWTVDDRSVVFV